MNMQRFITLQPAQQRHITCFKTPSARRVSTSVQRCTPRCVAVANIAATSATTAIFAASTVAVLPFYTLMTMFPGTRLAQSTMRSPVPDVVAALVYTGFLAVLLHQGLWSDIQPVLASSNPLPSVEAFASLFTKPRIVLLAWLHLLTLDLYQAKKVFLDGIRNGVWTVHSVVLCFMFGPLGLLSHWLTKLASAWMHGKAPREEEYILYKF